MDDFHTEIYGMPSLTTDATYTEPEPFQSMYTDYADAMHAVPSFEGSASFMDTFQQNVQGMLMGTLTPRAGHLRDHDLLQRADKAVTL